jgi:signal transduction histidine kinase
VTSRLKTFLGKNEAESDASFREELRVKTVRGLRAAAALVVVAPLFGAAMEALGRGEVGHEALFRLAAMAALGIASYGLSLRPPEWPAIGWWALLLAALVEWVHAAAGFGASVAATILFIAVALIPFRPMHVIVLAALTAAAPGFHSLSAANLIVAALIAIYVSGVLYGQRAAQFRAARDSVAARCRTVMAEHAASLVRLAAGLSHEMNSPLGALRSSADTMTAVSRRIIEAPPEEQGKLAAAQEAASEALRAAASRLEATVRRIQRLASLDCAEVTGVNVREFVESVAETARAAVRIDAPDDLEIRTNAAHFGFVLSALVGVAAELCEAPVNIEAGMQAGSLRVEAGGRMKAQEVEATSLFEPSFQETAGRIASRRWSLFTARQVAREHAGDVTAGVTADGMLTLALCLPAEK